MANCRISHNFVWECYSVKSPARWRLFWRNSAFILMRASMSFLTLFFQGLAVALCPMLSSDPWLPLAICTLLSFMSREQSRPGTSQKLFMAAVTLVPSLSCALEDTLRWISHTTQDYTLQYLWWHCMWHHRRFKHIYDIWPVLHQLPTMINIHAWGLGLLYRIKC